MNLIPYGRQSITEEDIARVVEVLKSDWLTQGPAIEAFESAVANYCGAKYAVAVSNATAGLHIACLAADLGPGKRLWTSPNTFVASANCGRYCGATVDFVDIDPETYNMCMTALECKLADSEKTGTLPHVVVPVHFAGQSCDMERLEALAKRYGFTVIEDAAHGIGGSYKTGKIGACRYSAMAVFSFHPVKIVTTGEGGMVLTNDEQVYRRLLRLRSHGITREQAQLDAEGPWAYEQLELGFNFRMTDIQAALGISQMQRLDRFVEKRHQLAKRYDEKLQGLPLTLPWQHPDAYSAYHLYVVRLQAGLDRRAVFEGLRRKGIGVQVHYIPVHTQPYYRHLGFKRGDFPAAEAYYSQAFSLPLYYDLTLEQQDRVIETLHEILSPFAALAR